MLAVYLRLVHGPTIVQILYYILLVGQCLLILLGRMVNGRRLALPMTIAALAVCLAMILFGAEPVANATDLLWPLVFWLLTVMDAVDVRVTVLFIIVSLIVVLMSGLNAIVEAVVGAGLVSLYFAMRTGRLRRIEEAYLARMHKELEVASIRMVEQVELKEQLKRMNDAHGLVASKLNSALDELETFDLAIRPDDADRIQALHEHIISSIQNALGELTGAVRDVESAILRDALTTNVFKSLVRQFEEVSQLQVQVEWSAAVDGWPSKTVATLYMALQEALTNVVKHARAASVVIVLAERDRHAVLEVTDDGGMENLDALREGLGLQLVRQRVALCGGDVRLTVSEPHGLSMRVTVPVGTPLNDHQLR